MSSKNNIVLDYSQLSVIREYAPLNSDPMEFDIRSITETSCRDCSAHLDWIVEIADTDWSYPAAVMACDQCGWWCQYAVGHNRDGFFEWERVPAALRQYPAGDINVPVEALRRELSKRSDVLQHLHPTKMEVLVGSVLSDFMDCEVVHTGRTGDGGVDLLLLDGGTPYAIQVKRRARAGSEKVSAVREFVGATLIAGYQRGIYVTTAPYYAPSAIGAAQEARCRRVMEKFHLIDRGKFLKILKLASKKETPPWRAFYGREVNESISVKFHGESSPESSGRLELWERH